jgi:hypothetical protein
VSSALFSWISYDPSTEMVMREFLEVWRVGRVSLSMVVMSVEGRGTERKMAIFLAFQFNSRRVTGSC